MNFIKSNAITLTDSSAMVRTHATSPSQGETTVTSGWRQVNGRAWAVVGLVALLSACGDDDDDSTAQATLAPKIACASLQGRTFVNVDVVAVAQVAASGAIPSYCKVNGTEAGTQHDI